MTSELLSVTVTYHPDLEVLSTQLRSLPIDVLKIVVDNASSPDEIAGLRVLVAALPRATLIECDSNRGLAAAINLGVSAGRAKHAGLRWILLLDQDSEPEHGAVQALLDASIRLDSGQARLGAVGPCLVDVSTDLEHGFHLARGWRFMRLRSSQVAGGSVRVMGLNGSGTLVATKVWDEVGALDESLFIDHVDTEWSFRMQHAGYAQFGIPTARFRHRMGTKGLRYWFFGSRVWPHRSPPRHYYLFRNTIRLLGMAHVSRLWKFWAPAKLVLTATIHLLFDPERASQFEQMRRGVLAGLQPVPDARRATARSSAE